MAVTYTIVDLPPVWPGVKTAQRRRAPFKSMHTRTMKALDRELGHLRARQVQLALDLPRGGQDLRQDGMLKADARPGPAIVLSFLDRDGHRQAYPCDTFAWWEDNLHAIAVVLEDLRRAERYGVQSALIRAGFKAIPATTTTALSTEAAADVIAHRAPGVTRQAILADRSKALLAVRRAAGAAHPDAGGSANDFQLVQEAKRAIEAHFGGSL